MNVEAFEGRHHPLVKSRDRFRPKFQQLDGAVAAFDGQFVIDKVELDLEDAILVVHGRSGQAARRNIKRDIPPMIDERRCCHSDLPDDLRPHVQRRQGVLPVFQDKKRPGLIGHDW